MVKVGLSEHDTRARCTVRTVEGSVKECTVKSSILTLVVYTPCTLNALDEGKVEVAM